LEEFIMPVEAEIRQQPSRQAEVTENGAPSPEMTQRVAILAGTATRLNAAPRIVAQRALSHRMTAGWLGSTTAGVSADRSETVAQRMQLQQPRMGHAPIQFAGDGNDDDDDHYARMEAGEAPENFGYELIQDGPEDGRRGGDGGDYRVINPPLADRAAAADHRPPPAPAVEVEVGIGEHEVSRGPMFTDSLANCIAILGFDAATGRACLYHFNTGGSFDPDDSGMLMPIEEKIVEARGVVTGALGTDALDYQIVLGGLWRPGGFKPATKAAFVAMLSEVFAGVRLIADGYIRANWRPPNLTGV
jgi:hypothetical protein